MARKRFQRGSLRRQNGSVYGRWREDEKLPTGKTIRKERFEYLGTQKELPTDKLAYRELEKKVAHVNEVPYRPTLSSDFASFADRWQTSVMVTHKRSAQSSEASHIKKHLLPRFGELTMKVIESDPEAVQAWVSGLKLEPKSVKNIVTTARLMFDSAREWRYVTYNPFDKLRLKPQGLKDEEFALSLEQIRAIIEAAPEPYKTLYWILGETGIRAGEALALGFEHLDLKERLIFIRRKVWRGELETVKSRKGVRSFAISEQLAEHLKVFGSGEKSGFLFVYDGKPRSQDNLRKRHFRRLLRKLGIRMCGFHAFRHGNATLMDQLNVPSRTKMDRLGHEKLETTNRYTHSVSQDDRAAAMQIGNLIANGSIQ